MGLENNIIKSRAAGTTPPAIQLLRRPRRELVRSLRNPTSGSLTASQIRDSPKSNPITAGDISSVSVENFSK